MKFNFIILIFFLFFFNSCETINRKIEKNLEEESKELDKWLNKSEYELKISMGIPDRIDLQKSGKKYYIYESKKLQIKCVRKFEINPKNKIVGYKSKNCF